MTKQEKTQFNQIMKENDRNDGNYLAQAFILAALKPSGW